MRLLRLLGLAIVATAVVPLEASLIRTDLSRTIEFQQTSSVGFNFIGVYFEARSFTTNPSSLTTFNVTHNTNVPPSVQSQGMVNVGPGVHSYRSALYNTGGDVIASVVSMNNQFSQGNYTVRGFDAMSNQLAESVINYSGDFFPASFQAPQVTAPTFNALAAGIDPTVNFTFNWNSFDVHPNADQNFIYFSIRETFFGNVVWSAANPLAANVTSIVLPANTLLSNTAYAWDIFFSSQRISNVQDPTASFPWTQRFDTYTSGLFVTGTSFDVPEPATTTIALGLLALGLARRNRKR
jgi:hypothetical protein